MGAGQGEGAARLMELLGLSEDELCRLLDVDPLTLLSGQLEHRRELPILVELLDEAAERGGAAGAAALGAGAGTAGAPDRRAAGARLRGVRGCAGRARRQRGFVLRGGGQRDG